MYLGWSALVFSIPLLDKRLVLHPSRGILPENVWNHVQLTHFNRLELRGKMEASTIYASQG